MPNKHLQGHGCPLCSGKLRRLHKTLTTEEFIIKAKKIHGEKYNYNNSKYIKAKINIAISCPEHGEFFQMPTNHLGGAGCPECVGMKKVNSESFIKKSQLIHGNKYDYKKSIYDSSVSPLTIICQKHGEFLQRPDKHLQGHGCPLCKTSKGEIEVAQILNNKNIKYIKQKRFKDCINPTTKYKLSYDYYLPQQKMLIEYNGMQHYKHIKYYHKHGKTLESQQYRDHIKRQYALKNGFKFLVIKYNNRNIDKTLTNALSIPASQP